MSDPRFARLKSDPRFRRPKKHTSKVVVDKRFQSVFDKSKNKEKKTDKYGRALSKTHETDNLRRFYKLEDGEDEDEPPTIIDYARGGVLMESSDEESGAESDEGGVITFDPSSSKRRAHDSEEEEEIDLDENNFADLDAQAAAYSKALDDDDGEESEPVQKTNRLAVVNLDWDHVRAVHLFKVFSSLVDPTAPTVDLSVTTPKGKSHKNFKNAKSTIARGRVLNIRVYPSQFGKERMAREEKEGPPAEVFKKRKDDDEELDEKTIYEVGEGEDYDEDALRKYQLERLRYYYAIVNCDTTEAASHIFDELEGTEFERSANVFDLSFVPDDMSFDDEPRDEATDATTNYKGLEFVTDALRHSKVKLTWDEDDPERNQFTRRKLTREEIDNADFKAYIASSESESEEDAEVRTASSRDKLRALLLGGDNDQLPEGWGRENGDNGGDDVDMEVTFAPGLSSAKGADDETTLERYQRKMKEKRKKQKEDRRKPNEDEGEDEFFAAGSGSDEEEPKLVSKRGKGKQRKARDDDVQIAPQPVTSKAELALLATSDDPNEDKKHFDFKAVVKAEKSKKRKGKSKQKRAVDQDEIQEDFQINVKDARFAAVHENHAFAIDPSHPQFKKTKSMAALLDERAARQRGTKGKEQDTRRGDGSESVPNQKSLDSLVESVKRKSSGAHNGGKGKRLKM